MSLSAQRLCSLAAVLVFAPCSAMFAQNMTTKAASTTPSAATRISTIIKDAIDVALPNTTKMIDTIFGSSITAHKASATAAVNKQVDASAQASNAKLKDIASIAVELNAEYLEQSAPASQKISSLLTRLADTPAVTMPTSGTILIICGYLHFEALVQKLKVKGHSVDKRVYLETVPLIKQRQEA
jgi:hypothetical protein